jgi:hypothetical protein
MFKGLTARHLYSSFGVKGLILGSIRTAYRNKWTNVYLHKNTNIWKNLYKSFYITKNFQETGTQL